MRDQWRTTIAKWWELALVYWTLKHGIEELCSLFSERDFHIEKFEILDIMSHMKSKTFLNNPEKENYKREHLALPNNER